VRGEVLATRSLTARQLAAWRELSEEAIEPNPFFDPDFVMPSAEVLAGGEVPLLVATEGDRWLACLPVRAAWRWKRVPSPALTSWVHLYCFFGTPLVAPGAEEEAVRALLDAAAGMRRPILGLDLVGGDGPVMRALEAAAEPHGGLIVYERRERAALHRGGSGGEIALNTKHRRDVARQGRRLSELLDAPLEVVDQAGDPAAVDDFLRLEAGGWKGKEGTAFASIGHAGLFKEISHRFAERGHLELLTLAGGGRVAAVSVNLLAGDAMFCFKIAFDEELSRYSPGIQLQVALTNRFQDNAALKTVDSCAVPGNQMINRLWTGRRPVAAVVAPLGGAGGALGGNAVRAVAALRRRRQP
jgi:CelD/BcsL family acetyltransferase involved in cellulose biosynthesis